jgi:hypothetical protein
MSGILNNTELRNHASNFFAELKPAPNNKDIFNVEYIQQCKLQFEPPKHKMDIAQCANCLKEERCDRIVLKNMHYSINTEEIKTKDMGTPKIIASSNRDASNLQVTT